MRNIGIAAHVDCGKSTVTERVLYYTGRIREMHEVRGKTGKGATMDSMDLERERGITIQSAATYAVWKDMNVNLIDTPGHVDFTIEVERALRVLDGAVMLVCGVSGVQSQTMTVDKQMRRYSVPRVTFINKLDRAGADPDTVVSALRSKVRLNAAATQVPIGLEDAHRGVVDVITMSALTFDDEADGSKVVVSEDLSGVPDAVVEDAALKREMLLEALADVDDDLAEIVLNDEDPSVDDIKSAIRRATLSMEFTPVLMGSAFKNKGVQPLLDAVVDYLPSPLDVKNYALDLRADEAEVELLTDAKKELVALAFKLEDGPHGTLTYMRVYQGTLKKGDFMFNVTRDEKVKVNRLVRMHAASMEDVAIAGAGDICAMFGVDCASGDTFTNSRDVWYSMTSMHVPEPVISLSIKPKTSQDSAKFSKGLGRFQREDPTLRVDFDDVTKETIISGMGELHLDVYIERLKREYGVETETGRPRVKFTEGLTTKVPFNYTHKKQSGGSGQFGRVIGYIEPLTEEEVLDGELFVFEDATVGNNIPPQFLPAVERGFKDAVEKGPLTGHPIVGVRVVLEDGLAHAVDSNEMSFKLAARSAFQQGMFFPNHDNDVMTMAALLMRRGEREERRMRNQ